MVMSGSSCISRSGASTAVASHRGQQIAQVCRTVHDWLVRRVISDIVVIDDETAIEGRVFVGIVKADAEEVPVNGGIDGAVEQRARELDVHLFRDDGMRIARED